MPIRVICLSLVLLSSPVLLFAQQKKKTVEPIKPAVVQSTPPAAIVKEPEAYANLLVDSDLDVNITVNYGKTYRVSRTDEGKRIPLEAGDNLLKITPLDGGIDEYTETIKIDKKGNRVYSVRLNAARIAEQQKKEEEARKAEAARLAEQRGKEEKPTAPLVGTFILIKGGTFEMGCTGEQEGCYYDEKPVDRVTLGDYFLGETEVTQAQWRAVMGNNPSYNVGCNQCPVEQVSWEDIMDFLRRLNEQSGGLKYRLPTEAEWEYAARGGKESRGDRYSGSNSLEEVSWYRENSGGRSHMVKGKRPNELGLYDMSGNVWEWCSDWKWGYSAGAQTSQMRDTEGTFRVLRGGSCGSEQGVCRVAYRAGSTPDNRLSLIGFRLARTY